MSDWLKIQPSVSECVEVTNERRNTTQWPQPEVLHCKFGVEASRVHVVPKSSRQHFTVARGETEQQSLSSCQQWNEPGLFVRSRLGLLSTADSYLSPYPLPSHRPETATFQCTHGKWGIQLPPPKNIFLSKTSFHRHIIANIARNVSL